MATKEMTKQEVIRNELIDFLDGFETPYTDEDNRPRGHVDELLERLQKKGVCIRADKIPDYHFGRIESLMSETEKYMRERGREEGSFESLWRE